MKDEMSLILTDPGYAGGVRRLVTLGLIMNYEL